MSSTSSILQSPPTDGKTDLLFTPPFPFQRLSSLVNSQRLHDRQLEDQRLLTMQPQAQCTTPSTSYQTTLTPPCSHSSTPPPPSPMDSLPPTPTPPSSRSSMPPLCLLWTPCHSNPHLPLLAHLRHPSVSYGLPATHTSLFSLIYATPSVSYGLPTTHTHCLPPSYESIKRLPSPSHHSWVQEHCSIHYIYLFLWTPDSHIHFNHNYYVTCG